MLVLFSLFAILGIGMGERARIVFFNKVVRFLTSISMEIYLSHMFAFRLLEKLKLIHLTKNAIIDYIITCIGTICGAVVMAVVINACLGFFSKVIKNIWRKHENLNG